MYEHQQKNGTFPGSHVIFLGAADCLGRRGRLGLFFRIQISKPKRKYSVQYACVLFHSLVSNIVYVADQFPIR